MRCTNLERGNVLELVAVDERADVGHGRLVGQTGHGVAARTDRRVEPPAKVQHLAGIGERRLQDVAVGNARHVRRPVGPAEPVVAVVAVEPVVAAVAVVPIEPVLLVLLLLLMVRVMLDDHRRRLAMQTVLLDRFGVTGFDGRFHSERGR